MIAILIKTDRHSGLPEVIGVRTQRADVETWLANLGSDSGRVEVWAAGKSEPDAVVYTLEEWERGPLTTGDHQQAV